MLPVSAWPPGPPGAALSPFGAPRVINVGRHRHGFVIPKGTWVVHTGANRVVMFRPSWKWDLDNQPSRQMGTGILPGALQRKFGFPFPPHRPFRRRPTHDEYLEAWRAWQRRIGFSDPIQRPIPGRVPPNWAGWWFSRAPGQTLVPFGRSGTVIADGQNVVIVGGGKATITQAF